jgi:hypothetical protein
MPTLRLEPYRADQHYPLLQAWWKARGDQCLPADVLPPTGAVALHGDEPAAICSIWLTNAKAAYLAFPITAPELSPRLAYEAVTLAVKGAIDLAKVKGVTFIWAAAENRGVDRIFTRLGLTRTTPLHNYFLLTDAAISHDILVGAEFPEQKG